jgi:hypothetical protein
MEEETDGCRNCNKRLLKFRFDGISNNGLDIWAGFGIVISI